MRNNLCFLIPYYNHPENINKLLNKLLTYNLPVIIVDDGSNPLLTSVLTVSSPLITIISYSINQGKGSAVITGMKKALEMGFHSCFQIDADAQHDLLKINEFLEVYKHAPESLICAKPVYSDDIPKSRLYGRKITAFWVYVNTLGAVKEDTMIGMRIYPLTKLNSILKCVKGKRMDFDTDILLCCYKNNINIKWVDVNITYSDNNVSHFRMVKDNVLISLMHTRHFLSLPLLLFKKNYRQVIKSLEEKKWWNKKEKAGIFLLKITLYLVTILPAFILKFVIFIVTLFYYAVNKEERNNIAIYRKNLKNYFKDEVKEILSHTSVFSNFYAFSESICDKIAVWKGKIEYNDLVFANEKYLHNELSFGFGKIHKSGQILLVSHFGNIEVLRAVSRHIKETKIAILVYQKNSQAFASIINEISQTDLRAYDVEDLSIDKMLELSELLKSGCHIGIMADRVSVNDKKNIKVKFLGQDCYLPTGAFILAGLLKCPVTTIWCEKINGKYNIELEKIADNIILSRNKEESVRKYVEQYVSILEKHVKNNPSQWFNFYNFWQVTNENNK